MITKEIDVQDAQANLHDLLSLVRGGMEIVLKQGTTPVARVVPIAVSSMPRVAGLHEGAIWTSDDFDEPLPEDFWTGAA
ncbi:MAG: toxin-antitoxin (TA) system antitoxin [Deltaproteobacteria bacterium]|nr:toxin-antitoxin (TA) system antitoxin [Deltaproteobacteria bacterium]